MYLLFCLLSKQLTVTCSQIKTKILNISVNLSSTLSGWKMKPAWKCQKCSSSNVHVRLTPKVSQSLQAHVVNCQTAEVNVFTASADTKNMLAFMWTLDGVLIYWGHLFKSFKGLTLCVIRGTASLTDSWILSFISASLTYWTGSLSGTFWSIFSAII